MTQENKILLFYTSSSKIHSQCKERIIRYIKSHTIRTYKDSIRLYDKLFGGSKAVFIGHKEIVYLINSYRAQRRFEKNTLKKRKLIVLMKRSTIPPHYQYSLKEYLFWKTLDILKTNRKHKEAAADPITKEKEKARIIEDVSITISPNELPSFLTDLSTSVDHNKQLSPKLNSINSTSTHMYTLNFTSKSSTSGISTKGNSMDGASSNAASSVNFPSSSASRRLSLPSRNGNPCSTGNHSVSGLTPTNSNSSSHDNINSARANSNTTGETSNSTRANSNLTRVNSSSAGETSNSTTRASSTSTRDCMKSVLDNPYSKSIMLDSSEAANSYNNSRKRSKVDQNSALKSAPLFFGSPSRKRKMKDSNRRASGSKGIFQKLSEPSKPSTRTTLPCRRIDRSMSVPTVNPNIDIAEIKAANVNVNKDSQGREQISISTKSPLQVAQKRTDIPKIKSESTGKNNTLDARQSLQSLPKFKKKLDAQLRNTGKELSRSRSHELRTSTPSSSSSRDTKFSNLFEGQVPNKKIRSDTLGSQNTESCHRDSVNKRHSSKGRHCLSRQKSKEKYVVAKDRTKPTVMHNAAPSKLSLLSNKSTATAPASNKQNVKIPIPKTVKITESSSNKGKPEGSSYKRAKISDSTTNINKVDSLSTSKNTVPLPVHKMNRCEGATAVADKSKSSEVKAGKTAYTNGGSELSTNRAVWESDAYSLAVGCSTNTNKLSRSSNHCKNVADSVNKNYGIKNSMNESGENADVLKNSKAVTDSVKRINESVGSVRNNKESEDTLLKWKSAITTENEAADSVADTSDAVDLPSSRVEGAGAAANEIDEVGAAANEIDAVGAAANEIDAVGAAANEIDAVGAAAYEINEVGATANEIDEVGAAANNVDTCERSEVTDNASHRNKNTNVVTQKEADSSELSLSESNLVIEEKSSSQRLEILDEGVSFQKSNSAECSIDQHPTLHESSTIASEENVHPSLNSIPSPCTNTVSNIGLSEPLKKGSTTSTNIDNEETPTSMDRMSPNKENELPLGNDCTVSVIKDNVMFSNAEAVRLPTDDAEIPLCNNDDIASSYAGEAESDDGCVLLSESPQTDNFSIVLKDHIDEVDNSDRLCDKTTVDNSTQCSVSSDVESESESESDMDDEPERPLPVYTSKYRYIEGMSSLALSYKIKEEYARKKRKQEWYLKYISRISRQDFTFIASECHKLLKQPGLSLVEYTTSQYEYVFFLLYSVIIAAKNNPTADINSVFPKICEAALLKLNVDAMIICMSSFLHCAMFSTARVLHATINSILSRHYNPRCNCNTPQVLYHLHLFHLFNSMSVNELTYLQINEIFAETVYNLKDILEKKKVIAYRKDPFLEKYITALGKHLDKETNLIDDVVCQLDVNEIWTEIVLFSDSENAEVTAIRDKIQKLEDMMNVVKIKYVDSIMGLNLGHVIPVTDDTKDFRQVQQPTSSTDSSQLDTSAQSTSDPTIHDNAVAKETCVASNEQVEQRQQSKNKVKRGFKMNPNYRGSENKGYDPCYSDDSLELDLKTEEAMVQSIFDDDRLEFPSSTKTVYIFD